MTASDDLNAALSDPYVIAYPEAREFWLAAAQDRLLVKTCCRCQKAHWYPRVICPLCGGEETEWREASGKGSVYSFSVIRRTETPYVLAYVRLEEGPVMMTNIVDCEFDALHIGQAVQARFMQAAEGRLVPVFAPVD